MLLSGGAQQVLLRDPQGGAYAHPNWGPRSRSIAVAHFIVDYTISDEDLAAAIATVRPDGGGYRELTRPGGQLAYFDERPAWAPTGGQIVYDEYWNDGQTGPLPRGIWIMNGDGSNRHRIVRNGTDPDWQPLP